MILNDKYDDDSYERYCGGGDDDDDVYLYSIARFTSYMLICKWKEPNR